MLLQYNSTTNGGQWEAVELSTFINTLPVSGKDNINIVDSLNTIQNPENKDIAVIGEDVYLYNGTTWLHLTNSELENQIGQKGNPSEGIPATGLYKEIADLAANTFTKTEVLNQIAGANHLKYAIVTNKSDIDLNNEDVVKNTIFLVMKSPNAEDGYDEYFVIDGELEKIGSWGADLNNYVQKTDTDLLLSPEQKQKLDTIGLDEETQQAVISASQVSDLTEIIYNSQKIKDVDPGSFEITSSGVLQLKATPSIDLSNYVKTETFNSTVGDLQQLKNRVKEDSTLVDEINSIKVSVIWHELNAQNLQTDGD